MTKSWYRNHSDLRTERGRTRKQSEAVLCQDNKRIPHKGSSFFKSKENEFFLLLDKRQRSGPTCQMLRQSYCLMGDLSTRFMGKGECLESTKKHAILPAQAFSCLNNVNSICPFCQFSHSVIFDVSRPHGLQHARLPCPSPTPGACSNSYPSSWWCHPIISSSVIRFSSCLQLFPLKPS